MLKRMGTSLRIGIAKTGITLVRVQGWRRRHLTVLAEITFDGHVDNVDDQALTPLRTALNDANCAGMSSTIVLADDWVRYFMVTPPHNAVHLSDCKAAAAMRFQALYGDSPGEWTLEADWDACHPFLVCAVPQSLLNSLEKTASDCKLHLLSILPHFTAAWSQWQKDVTRDDWFGVVHQTSLTLGIFERGQPLAVRNASIPAGAKTNPGWLQEHAAREALRLGLTAPARVQVCGNMPTEWLDQPHTPVCTRVDAQLRATQAAPMSSGMRLAMAGVAG